MSELINDFGLLMDVIGAIMISIWGIPQKEYVELPEEYESALLTNPIPNPGYAEYNKNIRKLKSRHIIRSRIAILFIIVGFILQLISGWI